MAAGPRRQPGGLSVSKSRAEVEWIPYPPESAAFQLRPALSSTRPGRPGFDETAPSRGKGERGQLTGPEATASPETSRGPQIDGPRPSSDPTIEAIGFVAWLIGR